MSKKIVFVLPSLEGGGAEKFIIRLANAFADKHLDVSLVILTNASDDYLEEISPHVGLIRLNQTHGLGIVIALTSFFKHHKPDVILSTLTPYNILCLISKLLSQTHAKIFIRETTLFSQFKRPKDHILKILAKLFYPFANGIISPSHDVYQDNLKLGFKNKNMKVIYNFVDKKHLQDLSALPTDLPPNFAKPLIIAAGRLTDKKNYAYLIKSFAEFRNQYDYVNAKLIILGKGPLQSKLIDLIHDLNLQHHVFIKGFLKNPYPYFAKCDLFVHTSKVEGLANVLLAALALECNIVTTDCAGSREALNNGAYGKLIPIVNDPKILAKAMHEAIEHPTDKTLLSHSTQKFNVETVVSQYLEFMSF